MKYIGIDYSLSCPAVTILGIDDNFENAKSYFLTDKKKFIGQFGNVYSDIHGPYTSFMERYENIANQIISFANPSQNDIITLEDYSMGSKGLLFSIAENTAILKYLLHQKHVKLNLVSPGAVKKFFTGKGNADKTMMYDSFHKKTGIDLIARLNVKSLKIMSPIADIVDSYAIALLGKQDDNRRS